MTGKHRRPQRSAARNLAATAAVITAGALPLAAAGSAFADTAPAAQGPLASLSSLSLSQAPFGIGGAMQPVDAAVPLAGTVADAAATSVDSGDLPTGSLLGPGSAQDHAWEAVLAGRARSQGVALAAKTSQAAHHLAAELPVSDLAHEADPGIADAPAQPAPNLLQEGGVGTFTDEFGGRAMDLTDRTVGQMHPVVSQLHGQGVPTVGDVTTSLSRTDVPAVGTVGHLTSAIPVSRMVGQQSPVLGAVGAAGGL